MNKEKNREYAKKYYHRHKELCAARREDYRKRNPERTLWYKAKDRSRRFNIPFDIEVSDVNIPTHCPILGIELSPGIGKVGDASPSLDKIKPEKGYIKGNVAVISYKANRYKSDLSLEQVQKLLNYLSKEKA